MAADKSAFLKLAKARFEQATDANKNQLQRELDDLQFYNGEQWPADVRASRSGQNASNGLPPVPARPCITINKVRQPVRQVLNQEREAEMGVEIAPADDFGDVQGAQPIDETEIDLREGLVRRIQRESQAKDARTWAFARAVQAGRGYYGVMTRFSKQSLTGTPEPSWWDQEVFIQRFYNQSSVVLDPAHEQPDGSDAEWGFVGSDMPWDAYVAQFREKAYDAIGRAKDNRSEGLSDAEFRTLGDVAPGWYYETGPENKRTRMCRVVDYYSTERTTKTLAWLPGGQVVWADQVPPGVTPQDTREVIQKQIKWAKLDGCQVLEETDWPGQFIPIIKCVGEELQPHNTERICEGMVRPAKEANQGFNFMVSKWVEMVGLAPLTPLMVEEGQVEGYEEWYNQANTRTLPYLPFKMKNLEGDRAASPPFPAPRDVPIAPVAASVQMFDEAIKDTTGVPASTLGDTDPTLKSGKAIRAVLEQSWQGTRNYLDNLARSIRHEGLIINDLLYPIYNREGRLARIINGQGEAQTILINQPFTMQGEGKLRRPMPAEQGAEGAKQYRLTKDASFNVAVKVVKNTDTRREQESAMVGGMIEANPALMGVFGDLFFKNLDGPGHREMAERAKVLLVPPVQKLLQEQASGMVPVPPEAQAKIDQAGQMIQALSQKVQELQQEVSTDQAKQQATIAKAQMDNQAKLAQAQLDAQTALEKAKIDGQVRFEIAQLDAQVTVDIAEMKAKTDRDLEAAKLAHADLSREDQQAFEHAESAVDRHHESVLKAADHAQAEAQASQVHKQGLEAGEASHKQNLEAGETAHKQNVELLERTPEDSE
jgi:hypothetical protein